MNKRSYSVIWMQLVLVAIAFFFVGLVVREIWAINTYSTKPSLQGDGWYCGTPMFTGRNWRVHFLQILQSCALLLPIAFAPWALSWLVSFVSLPSRHQLSELWWTIRGRNC